LRARHLGAARNYVAPATGHGSGTRFREAAKIASELPPHASPTPPSPAVSHRPGKIFRLDSARPRTGGGKHGRASTRRRRRRRRVKYSRSISIFTEAGRAAVRRDADVVYYISESVSVPARRYPLIRRGGGSTRPDGDGAKVAPGRLNRTRPSLSLSLSLSLSRVTCARQLFSHNEA